MPASTMVCPRCWGRKLAPACDKCQNAGQIPDVRLSKNFALSELVISPTAMTRGIPNDPNSRETGRLAELCARLLQPLRDSVGPVHVTSGFRSPKLNIAIGGSATSAHPEARAADVQAKLISVKEIIRWFWERRSELPFDQVILEYGELKDAQGDDWVHIGYKHPTSGAQRRQFLVKTAEDRWYPWTPDWSG